MKVDKWLQFFQQHNQKKLFSFTDLAQLTDIKKNTLSVELTRLVKNKIIQRCAHNWYENPYNPPSVEEISMVLRYPSYLSMEYALSKQGILNQVAQVLTLVTTKLPYTYHTKRTIFEYHQVQPTLYWGYQKQAMVQFAEPEKALLDLIYIRYTKNNQTSQTGMFSLIDDMAIEEFNPQKLQQYTPQYSTKTREVLAYVGLLHNK